MAVHEGRFSARAEGDFVVFLVGMRVNKPWKVHRWLPVMRAMQRMLRVIDDHPELGCLGHERWLGRTIVLVQYWRSVEDLHRFSTDGDLPHLEPWRRFNRTVRDSGDVGVWHETYKVRAGEYEAIYGNMPTFGLAAATAHVPVATLGHSSPARLGTGPDTPPVAPY